MNQNLASIVRARGIVLVLALLSFCQSLIAADYYISPTGNDSNGGTLASPFATFERARDMVRAQIAGGMSENITVHIGAGNYFIENAVVFDDRDAGRDGFTITYQGAPNLGSRIYGGRRITNWTKVSDKEYRATVADLQQHFTLYENDQAANGGLYHTFTGETKGNWARNATSLTYFPRNLPIADQVVVLGTTKDVFIIKGRTNQQIVRNLVFDGLHMIGSDFTTSWPGGVTEFPSWTGTYDGVPMVSKPIGVIFPEARHGQFFVENAQNIVIRNSKLYGAGFMAVFVHRWAQQIRVENCWIENAGCSGVFFMGWEPGRGASEGITTLAAAYCNKFNVVRNNVFHGIGRFQNDGAAVYLCWSGDNLIEHNVIKGATRYGVSSKGWRPRMINNLYYWVFNPRADGKDGQLFAFDQADITYYDGYVVTEANQGAELNHSRNNIIRYNDISQIGWTGYDFGMIEAWGAGYDNVWAHNACHDGVHLTAWDNAWLNILYVDDGAHRTTIEGNILYWFAGGAMTTAIVSKGNDQINRHNIIADCETNWATSIGPFVEQARNASWTNNIVASQFGNPLNVGNNNTLNGGIASLTTNENNLYYRQPLDRRDGGGSTMTPPAGGISADPQFDRQNPWWDAHYTDYKLKSTSPALPLGFQETDMSLIGVRNDYPFNVTEILGQSAGKIRLAADFSRLLKVRASGEKIQSRDSVAPLPVGSWARYNDLDFDAGQFEQLVVRYQRSSTSSNQGPTIEVRLNAPDGPVIGTVPYAQSTCRITPTTGCHDVFLVFPNANVQSVDWFVFNPRTVWTGNGTDNKWSTAANWTGTPNASEPLYFGPSSRPTPSNDLSSGSSFAGLEFDSDAPAYMLAGNAITLTGDVANRSANPQTIQMPLVFSSLGALRVDTGSAGMTLSGTLSGAASGICTELIKSGTGTLTLTGAFNFKGNITIESGTLTSLQPGIDDTATLSMNSLNGAALDLKHGLTERVARLYLNGVSMPDGTYGSSASAADYKDDSTFRGKGVLLVQSGPTPPMLSTRADGFTLATFSGAGTGTWSVPPGVSQVEVLVVGGGGGGAKLSGGGGAGGLYHGTSYVVTPGAVIPITVGAGGAAGTGTGNGGDGGFSQFGNHLLAYGGTRGLNSYAANGGNQGGYSLNGGTTIIAGMAPTEPRAVGFWSGSGAGAAGTLGGSAAGGIGVASNITGQSRFYAGGGGSNAGGLGGSGIGGNGATAANATNATAGAPNTGSGGGGGNNGLSPNGGGSGIVIVAYQASPVTPTTTLLASSANPSNNGNDVTFTATVKANNITATDATGNYVFTLNGATVATVPIINGSASYTTNLLPPGPHFIEAIYYGDIQYDASSATLTQSNTADYDAAAPLLSTRPDGRTIAKFSNTSLAYWEVPQGIDKVEVMILGGGGSGAFGNNFNADGGGAGGLTYKSSHAVIPGRLLPVVAGAGGPARTTGGDGFNGSASYFDVTALTALGGEGGLTSRGGNAGAIHLDGVITQGGLGGTHSLANGGGGLGQDGGGAYDYCPGGNGIQFGITGSSIYYGGGGGGNYNGAGGLGGGGRGGFLPNGSGQPGVDGLGGGGGGGRTGSAGAVSGKGGDGIVILVYSDVSSIWSVSFESSGGSAIPSQTVGGGNAATPPANPTKSGYTFGGWFPDISLTSPFNFRTPITADTTLYAKWLTNRTVSFESNGGSAVASQTVATGDTATPPVSPTRSGYAFAGWYADGGLTVPFDFETAITADTTLYAKWLTAWIVSFASNGGSAVPQQLVVAGEPAIQPAAPTRSGFLFDGWFTDGGFTAPFNFATAITADITLYAKWGASYTWTSTALGTYNWNNAESQNNWTSGFPNDVSASASLNINLAGAQTINLNQTITVGTINIGDTASTYYSTTLAANGGSLIMDAFSGNATISKTTAANNVTDTISADILLNDDLVVHNAATGGMLTLSGIVSGSGRSLEKTGAGTLRLSNANTYSGTTTITAGTLQLGTGATGGNGSVAGGIVNNSTLNFNNANPQTISGDNYSGSGILSKTAGGTLTLTGTTTVRSLQVGYRAAGGTLTVGSGASLSVGSGASDHLLVGTVYASSTGGTGTLNVSASDNFTVNVGNLYVGVYTTSNPAGTGTSSTGATGTGTLSLGANNTIAAAYQIIVGGTQPDNDGPNNNSGTITTAANGSTTIITPYFAIGTAKGTGTFTLGANATLNLGNPDSRTELVIGRSETGNGYDRPGIGTMNLAAGTADLYLNKLWLGRKTVSGNTNTTEGTMTLRDASNHLDISGSGSVVNIGYTEVSNMKSKGTLTIGNLDATSSITTDSTNAAAIRLGVGALGDGTLNLNGGTLRITTGGSAAIAGGGGTVRALNLASNSAVTLVAGANSSDWVKDLSVANIGSNGLVIDTDGNTIGVSQAFSGTGGLTKSGLGTLTLTGASSYTGDTNVTGGTLVIDGENTATTGNVTVSNNARLGGNGSTPAAVTVQTGGKLLANISDWSGAPGTGFTDLQVGSLALVDSWTLDVTSLASYANFSESNKTYPILTATGGISGFDAANITVVADSFPGTGTWSVQKTGNTLELVYAIASVPVDDYLNWDNGYTADLSDKNADFDADGLSNFAEYAFGLDPTSGTSSNPITASLDKATKKFRYTRREGSGLNYTVETSTTLQENEWTSPAAATQVVVATAEGVETVEVELLAPPSGDKLFVRVKAQ